MSKSESGPDELQVGLEDNIDSAMVVSAVRARMSCSTSLGVRVKRQYSYSYFYVSPQIVEWSSTFRAYVSAQLRSSMGTNPSEGFVFCVSFFLPLNIEGLQVIVLRAPSVISNLLSWCS